ncbi:MAG: hypothetical protein OEW87_11905 [Flavobacteriaceae bacterium]|nr:hypothetical protein [Flavobacteriaceae bacterium]
MKSLARKRSKGNITLAYWRTKLSWVYEPWEYGPFRDQFNNLPLKIQIAISEAIEERLKIDPCSSRNPVRSKILHGELEGIRRIHVDDNHIVAYIVCDECKREGYNLKFKCLRCFETPAFRIKLIACGPWKYIYDDLENQWPDWVSSVRR